MVSVSCVPSTVPETKVLSKRWSKAWEGNLRPAGATLTPEAWALQRAWWGKGPEKSVCYYYSSCQDHYLDSIH